MSPLNPSAFGLQVLLLLLSAIRFAHTQYEEYNYDRNGNDWPDQCRYGKNQSPISLLRIKAIEDFQLRISYNNYDVPLVQPIILDNTGLSAMIYVADFEEGQTPTITGGLMKGNFEVQSLHFHWGALRGKGSEHYIHFKQHDVEMHIVHKNTLYWNLTMNEASFLEDGLAVLAVMIDGSLISRSKDTPLTAIFNALPNVIQYQSSATVYADFSLQDLLENVENEEFFTYKGSLTTPPCGESVTWTVFKNPIRVPHALVANLRKLKDSRSRPLLNNHRQLQFENDRKVFYRPLYKNILSNTIEKLTDPFLRYNG